MRIPWGRTTSCHPASRCGGCPFPGAPRRPSSRKHGSLLLGGRSKGSVVGAWAFWLPRGVDGSPMPDMPLQVKQAIAAVARRQRRHWHCQYQRCLPHGDRAFPASCRQHSVSRITRLPAMAACLDYECPSAQSARQAARRGGLGGNNQGQRQRGSEAGHVL